ncbi:MAG: type II toxin-antitoxin system prevent-host-death family antitoxin [Candidatus Eremiobacteraeota bacterium]|nr:type II toxin-antitoxin system prevent-host-death family antitoxin [Candidatus Eremiobacteraeota bacterium]
MRQITTYDAKNRLSELLDAVAAGETIEIMRRGKPAARLVPIPEQNEHFQSPREAADWLRENRMKLADMNLRELIEEGRH